MVVVEEPHRGTVPAVGANAAASSGCSGGTAAVGVRPARLGGRPVDVELT